MFEPAANRPPMNVRSRRVLPVWFGLTVAVLAGILLSAPVAAQPIQHYYPLDSDELDVTDWVSNFGGGSLVGYDVAYVRPEGVLGRAVDFDGASQWIDFDSAQLLPRTAGSVVLWAKPANGSLSIPLYEGNGDSGGGDHNGFGSTGDIFEMHFGSGSVWSFYYQDGPGSGGSTGRFSVTGPPVEVGKWTHLAATWNRANDLVLYVDCEEVGRVAISGGTFSNHASTEFHLARPWADQRFFAGEIDEVRIFDEALLAPDIAPFCTPHRRDARPASTANILGELEADGDWLAVGLPNYEDDELGAVEVFELAGDGSLASSTVLEPNSIEGAGSRLSLAGDRLAIAEDAISDRSVWIFEYDPSAGWTEAATFSHPDPSSRFGDDLAISDDWLAVASPDLPAEGDVRMYLRLEGGIWIFQQTLESPSRGVSARFGHTVAIEGDVLAVSERFGVLTPEVVHIYRLLGGSWVFEQTLESADDASFNFGYQLEIDQQRIHVGASRAASYGEDAGNVLVYERIGVGETPWLLVDTLASPTPWPGEEFGNRVARDGDWLLTMGKIGSLMTPVLSWHQGNSGTWRLWGTHQPAQTDYWLFGLRLTLAGTRAFVSNAPSPGDDVVFQFELPLFFDNFETGSVAEWSAAVP